MVLLCSNCFTDEGLRIDSSKYGQDLCGECPICRSRDGRKLTRDDVLALADRFFVRGSTFRYEYGAAPVIQFNEYHFRRSNITPSAWLKNDLKLIEEACGVGFFHYGPRAWMYGEVQPLKMLQSPSTRPQTIERILRDYPTKVFSRGSKFYRLRSNPRHPAEPSEYDSPPAKTASDGRLDHPAYSIMYGSQDLDVCIHECRVSVADELFVATLKTRRDLRLLDLTDPLDETVTEFESLDMTMQMLFLARSHAYGLTREIALAANKAGFDGIIYPSYFSLLRTGSTPFETVYGMSLRRIHPKRKQYVEATTIRNLALFGRPVESSFVSVECINRLILTRVGYQGHFGPVTA